MSIVGTWKLVSHEIVSVASKKGGRKIEYPFGKKPQGLLVYTPRGHMSVAIASEKRKKFGKKGLMGGTLKQKADAISSYLSYSGKYRVDGNEVIHDVEVSLFPDWVGTQIRREVTIKGNLLVLSIPPFVMGGKKQVAHVTWKRVEL